MGGIAMKMIKSAIRLFMTFIIFAVIFFAGTASAQILYVDSVTVDSIWNSDSSFYDNNGILQTRISRDLVVGFKPCGQDPVHARFAISTDSARTWSPNPNPLIVLDSSLVTSFACNQRHYSKIRVLGGDREKVAIKVLIRNTAKPLELLQPVGGEGYNAGETVAIKWKINDTANISSVRIKLSTNNGVSFSDIADHSFEPSITSYDWTVDSEFISNQCIILIADYIDGSINDKSALFSINKKGVIFNDGFEGDLSKWSSSYMLNPVDPRLPRMTITAATAHGGQHAITTDSNSTALMLVIDSTAAFPKMKPIEDGVAGVEFYFMARSAGGINFTMEIGQNAGSSGGLGYCYGIGFDPSNRLKCTYSDLYNDLRNDSLYTPLEAGYWYKATIEVSFTAKTVNYYLDGVQIRTMPLHDGIFRLDRVLIFRGMDGAEGPKQYYADDLTLYTK
jgi:hypothetical protein